MICLQLFLAFFRIGLFTFGGGYAMLPLVQGEVLARGWLTSREIIDFIAVSESTPGPFAVNLATYVGMVAGGPAAAACATLGVVLPSVVVILLVARGYARFRRSRIVEGAMSGLRPAVVGLIAAALLSVGRDVLFPSGFALSATTVAGVAIFAAAAVLAFRKKHPVLVIGLCAAAGVAVGGALGL